MNFIKGALSCLAVLLEVLFVACSPKNETKSPGLEEAVAIINALALAKIILVAQELHFAEQLRDAPLIYPTLLKSFAFTMLLALFKVVEHTSVGMFHGKSFYAAIASSGDGSWKGTICLIALPTLFHRLHFDCATGSLFVL